MKPQRIIPVVLILLTGCVAVPPKITPEMSPVIYSKPESSNAMISGERVPYILWYDDSKWDFVDNDNPLYKQVEAILKGESLRILNSFLIHCNREVFFVIQESRLKASYDDIINETAKKSKAGEYELIEYDLREVNGNNVLFIKFADSVPDSGDWMTTAYFLANDKGHVAISATTQTHLFDEHQDDIFDILNGLDFSSENEDKLRILTNSEKFLINKASEQSNLAIHINVAEALNSCNLSNKRKQIWSKSIKQDTRNLLNRLLLNYKDKGYDFHIVKNIEHSQYVINATFTRYCSNNLITDHTNVSVTSAHDRRTYATDTIKREKRFDTNLSKWVVTASFLNGQPVEIDDTGLVFSK